MPKNYSNAGTNVDVANQNIDITNQNLNINNDYAVFGNNGNERQPGLLYNSKGLSELH